MRKCYETPLAIYSLPLVQSGRLDFYRITPQSLWLRDIRWCLIHIELSYLTQIALIG